MRKNCLKTVSIIFSIYLLLLNGGCKKQQEPNDRQTKVIKIICEDTVLPMVSDLVRDYNLNNDPVITVESATSESAFIKLSKSEADLLIGYHSPNDKQIETELLAYEGIGVIVNPNNKLDSISIGELKKAYTGDIVNWDKLKGESKSILPVAFKESFNSIQIEFSSKIMDIPVKEQVSRSIHYVSSVEEMKTFIANNKNTIGFIPRQWYNETVKFLEIGGIEISMSNIKNELYTLRFSINQYYAKDKEDSLKDLFKYFKSDDGKKIIRKYCIEA